MKYTKLTMFCALIVHTSIAPLDNYTNQIFMFVRPVFDSVGIQQSSWHNIAFRKQSKGSAFQIYPIYEQSFDNVNSPSYFLFNHKNTLKIQSGTTSAFTLPATGSVQVNTALNLPAQGQISVPTCSRDILGQWIGITDQTTSDLTFTVNPRQQQATVMFEFSQDLNKVAKWDMFENWFINVSAPITWIENNLGVAAEQKAIDAMNSSSFNFVRMTPGDQTSVRLTQASISLGTRYMGEPDTHVISTTGVIIPLVEQNDNRSIFQPMQGFNSHWGFDTTVLFQFPVCQKHEYSNSKILFFLDMHNNFLARNYQLRTYDIRHKPFSRYMLLYDNCTNSLVPAMNALTLRSRVEPFMIVNFATGFRMKYKESFGEIGYELWAHGREVLTPQQLTPHQKPSDYDDNCGTWNDQRYGIAFINTAGQLAKIDGSGAVQPILAGELGQTASQSTINYVAAPDGSISCCTTPPTFIQKNVYLSLKDLDYLSNASRSAIAHRAFASVGFGNKGTTRDCFANFGLFIEVSQNNAALCFWGGWFKAGLTF